MQQNTRATFTFTFHKGWFCVEGDDKGIALELLSVMKMFFSDSSHVFSQKHFRLVSLCWEHFSREKHFVHTLGDAAGKAEYAAVEDHGGTRKGMNDKIYC